MVSPPTIASLILYAAASFATAPSRAGPSSSVLAFAPAPPVVAARPRGGGGVRSMMVGPMRDHPSPSSRRRSARVVACGADGSGGEVEGEGAKGGGDDAADQAFWAKQRALAAQLTTKADDGLKAEQMAKFAARRAALTSDTLYFSILIGCALWLTFPNPFVTASYLFGALAGTAYSYGLGKYVESLGGSIDDPGAEGAGVGQARFAFLILLFVVVGKFRSQGLLEIPSIAGFFTYQLASLNQGLREIDD